jgi:hypothetical protein
MAFLRRRALIDDIPIVVPVPELGAMIASQKSSPSDVMEEGLST